MIIRHKYNNLMEILLQYQYKTALIICMEKASFCLPLHLSAGKIKNAGRPHNCTMKNTPKYTHVIGLMSGTSLDGLDIACCQFAPKNNGQYDYSITVAETIPYSDEWKHRLSTLENASAYELVQADAELGKHFGNQVVIFVNKYNLHPDLVASHGHTIFHRPELGFSTQIGNGNAIMATSYLPVIYDFRSLDVALGGQGAPLVPIGDQLLFPDYSFCLNLGGISNVSYNLAGKRLAYDISLCNIPLNYLSRLLGSEYDKDGNIARSGKINNPLLDDLNSLPYFSQAGPKSLGKEWFVNIFLPVLEQYSLSVQDRLRTVVEHVAFQITNNLENLPKGKMLVTGGGAFNNFLIERMHQMSHHEIFIPDKLVVNYKEALIFAFLGFLRVNNLINTQASVTGACENSCGGSIAGLPASLISLIR
jgi:anhydro-N-acetylmuramic acid kinase